MPRFVAPRTFFRASVCVLYRIFPVHWNRSSDFSARFRRNGSNVGVSLSVNIAQSLSDLAIQHSTGLAHELHDVLPRDT